MSEPFVAQLGRITGKLLSANLERNGFDLTFRNGPTSADLLYIDVNTNKIGINSNPPTQPLDVTGTGNITNNVFITGTGAAIDNLIFGTNGTVTTSVGPIIIAPTGPDASVQYGQIQTEYYTIKDNKIQGTVTNADITLDTSGTGKVDMLASTDIAGNLAVFGSILATGNVQANGEFIIGDSPIDTVTINPDFTQSIVPAVANTYSLGTAVRRWNDLYLNDLNGALAVTTANVVISDQLQFNSNTVSTLLSNDDLLLDSATGLIRIENISVVAGVITNYNNSAITISHTGTGYLVINDDNAFQIPFGNTAQRQAYELGATRWNNQLGYMECFDGGVWQVATGGGVVITAPIMEELSHVYTLIFG